MKKHFTIFFMLLFCFHTTLAAFSFELNTSYDYFRGMPSGSWNGNSGAYISGNLSGSLYECIGAQVGGSYGLYDWDGHENVVFKNPKALEQQAFVTGGLYTSYSSFNAGLLYDRMFVRHFGIYDVKTSFDQLRYHLGYKFCCEEVGFWGTSKLTTAKKDASGVPVSLRAISQVSFFWTHFFENTAISTIWVGAPYGSSLRYPHKTAGVFTTGFALRAPLTDCLFVDAHGSYMRARKQSGVQQSRNYGANVCVGITYLFGGCCGNYSEAFMPVANNSNFLIDTNVNQ